MTICRRRMMYGYDSYPIITDGLLLNVDAGNPLSYPGSGINLADLSGVGNNGTLINGVGFSSLNQGSLVFDGVNDYVSLPQIKPTRFTLSCWFKATGIPSTNDVRGALLISSNSQLFNGVGQYSLNYSWLNQNMAFTVQSNIVALLTQNGSILRNTVYNATSTYDGLYRRIYINGQLITSAPWTTNPIYPTTGLIGAQIGRWGYAQYGRYFNGNIYKAQIYNRALSDAEVLQNYNADKTRFGL